MEDMTVHDLQKQFKDLYGLSIDPSTIRMWISQDELWTGRPVTTKINYLHNRAVDAGMFPAGKPHERLDDIDLSTCWKRYEELTTLKDQLSSIHLCGNHHPCKPDSEAVYDGDSFER